MRKLFYSFLFFVLFWILYFSLCRLIFILFFMSKVQEGDGGDVLKSFLFGLPMDIATTAYIATLPMMVWAVLFLAGKVPARSNIYRWYMIIMIVLIGFLTIVDVNTYREWGTKLNYRAFHVFFTTPSLALASSMIPPVFISLIIGVILIVIGLLFYFRSKPIVHIQEYPHMIKRIGIVLAVFVLYVVALRGGISTSPLSISSAYYSNNQSLNHAAVNTEWNLVRDIIDHRSTPANPYMFMDMKEASAVCDSLLAAPDSTVLFLNTTKPNVVLIILESFTADLMASLNGEKNVTPFLDSLAAKSLLFTEIYASGSRTDIGFLTIHSGFPSQAISSLLTIPEKAKKVPSISSSFFQNGYHTSFYYGGESDFFNFRSFILNKDYKRLVDIRDFEKKDVNSKWGAHDDVVLKRLLNDLKNEPQPFFSTVLTLSNHEPFEIPVKARFPGNDVTDKFRSTAYYTDQSLKDFFAAAAKEDWYRNTLFILVADHGHRLPAGKHEIYMPRRSQIPLLFAGEVLKQDYKGKRINVLGSQGDLPATLLAQMGLDHKAFYWSKNLMNPNIRQFAFNSFDNGFLWIEKDGQVAFDNNNRKVINAEAAPASEKLMVRRGQAVLQKVYQEFISY
jgi:phosphoglycerol transferase MdoB-like AlkP superfamily enzyme